MSQARVYRTNKVRKDWTCGKCGAAIKKGVDGRLSFAVGFRGYERTRCLKPECYPTRSELESSALATIYDVIDGFDIDTMASAEEFTEARDEIVAACEEVASDYESNEMFEINEDLQERAEMISSAGDELSSWEPENEEPSEDEDRFDEQECTTCNGTGREETDDGFVTCSGCNGDGNIEAEEDFETAHTEWLEETRDSFREAVDGMELP